MTAGSGSIAVPANRVIPQNRCENCKFAELHDVMEKKYLCHRMPPSATAVVTPQGVGTMTNWPVVLADNWCGEWGRGLQG